MHPHLHMLASFALVDLARQAQVGEQLCKSADISTIPSELTEKVKGQVGQVLPLGSNLLKAVPEALGNFVEGGTGMLESGLRNAAGLKPNDVSFNTNPLGTLPDVLKSMDSAQGTLAKAAPGVGAVGGGLLGAGLGAGAAKLLQGSPEDEEDAKANRINMLLAALAGGGLGALGGSAASLQPMIQGKIHEIGQNKGVRGALESGAGMYGDVVTKVKDLISKLTAGKGGGVPSLPTDGALPATSAVG